MGIFNTQMQASISNYDVAHRIKAFRAIQFSIFESFRLELNNNHKKILKGSMVINNNKLTIYVIEKMAYSFGITYTLEQMF